MYSNDLHNHQNKKEYVDILSNDVIKNEEKKNESFESIYFQTMIQ